MSGAPSYVPLRVHGHHTLLAGVDSPRQLIERAERLGLGALALTDVDTLAGVVDFLQAAEGSTVRPILGAEISAPAASDARKPQAGRLIALVETQTGWRNLCKLVSARHLGDDPGQSDATLEGPAHFDRVGAASAYQEGLFFLVDHPELLLALHGRVEPERLFAAVSPAASELGNASTAELFRQKRATAARPRQSASAGGRGVGGIPGDPKAPRPGKTPPPPRPASARQLLEAARAVGVAALAVPDVYYAYPGGAHHHRVRTAIGHNALLTDLPEEWLAPAPAHLLAPVELAALFDGVADRPGPWPLPEESGSEATHPLVRRTLALAERCRYVPPLGQVHFPEVELPADETAYSRLCELAFDGARRRYRPLRPEVVRRLDYELTSIDALGFAPYFLLVKRIGDFARERRIPCVGRGSAADSLVSYCLELTDADPLRYRLPFERFLNPARKDRPDIDLDFCWRRRDEIIEHVYEAFGSERTAMVSTLNCFGIRAAFRETALAEGIPPAEVNLWSKRLPWTAPAAPGSSPDAARQGPVERALRSTPECRDFPHDDGRWQRVLRAADALLDTPRHFGLHPGGVVVSPGPITDFTACHASAKGPIAAQFDKDAIEAIGLVKMDLLGNRALTTLDDCLVELASRGIEPDLAELPEDDPDTAELLRTGRTLGCFQVESPGMRNLLQQTGSATMDDVIQAVALIRPGPAGAGMKDAYVRRFRGLEPPTAPHPRLTELLWDTHGIMLYQEDVMQAATLLAGMDLTEADLLRRTLQKQHGRELGPLRQRFIEGAGENGVDTEDALRVWELIANFVSFAFCKAHAVTYGRIAYRAVWLKAHHPAVYMAAFLASETGYYQPRVYVEEARRLGVPILPPDVNRSADTFAVEWVERGPARSSAASAGPRGSSEPCLRVGLRQVKGLSERLRRTLLEQRERSPFLSLTDLLERTGARVDEAANLIRCGALDSFDRTRPELLWRLHLLAEPQRRAPRDQALDLAQLDACRATPQSRTRDVIGEARSRTAGWRGRGLGVGNAELGPGETASLFPAPETPALVLPGLPDFDAHTRGLLEFELLGLTVHEHPTALFPCPADERIAALVEASGSGPATAERRALRVPLPGGVRPVNPITCGEVAGRSHGRVTVRGWLAASRRVRTASGEWMRFLTLEDETGLAEVVVFPDAYRRDGHRLAVRGVQCVTGIVEDHMGAFTVHAERIW